MWPLLLTAAVSAARMRPCFPPRIHTSSFEVGSVICARPERKATYLNRHGKDGETVFTVKMRDLLHSGGIVGTTVEFGRNDGVTCVRGMTQLLYCSPHRTGLVGNGERRGKLPAFEC